MFGTLTKNSRDSGFESLRILSILLILTMHTASIVWKGDVIPFNAYIISIIGSIENIGVTCFILISGYFGIKLKWNKLLQLIILTTGYETLSYVLREHIGYESGIQGLLTSILVIPLYKNWFITCYLILMLLSPYINNYTIKCSHTNFKKLLLTSFIVLSIIPTIFNNPYYTIVTSGGKCFIYFLFIYLIGRYIKLHHDKIFSRKQTVGCFISMTLLINLLNFIIGYIFHKRCTIYSMDCSPFILISAISIFYLFKSFTFKSNIINYISSSIIAVYLLDSTRLLWDYYVFKLANHANSYYMIVYLAMEVFITFTASIFIDKIRLYFLGKIEQKLIQRTINLSIILYKRFNYAKHKLLHSHKYLR